VRRLVALRLPMLSANEVREASNYCQTCQRQANWQSGLWRCAPWVVSNRAPLVVMVAWLWSGERRGGGRYAGQPHDDGHCTCQTTYHGLSPFRKALPVVLTKMWFRVARSYLAHYSGLATTSLLSPTGNEAGIRYGEALCVVGHSVSQRVKSLQQVRLLP
jgi:hypothetical protein